ncbi:hypothetical protein GCM10027614_43930 [Micromonospora vulcania]
MPGTGERRRVEVEEAADRIAREHLHPAQQRPDPVPLGDTGGEQGVHPTQQVEAGLGEPVQRVHHDSPVSRRRAARSTSP